MHDVCRHGQMVPQSLWQPQSIEGLFFWGQGAYGKPVKLSPPTLSWPAVFGITVILGACMTSLSPDSDAAALAGTPGAIQTMSWGTVNDTVMGGRSSAKLSWDTQGALLWEGNLSLENNGGFVSIRTEQAWFDWSRFDGLEVVLEGAGREIQLTAQRQDRVVRAGGYRALIPTIDEGETKVFVPFSAFVLKRFGRRIQGPALTEGLSQAGQLGLLIADKRPGPFRVTLKSITPVKLTQTTAVSTDVVPLLVSAVERGVPIFNAGDASACAAIYREVLSGLHDDKTLGTGTWAARLVHHALAQAKSEDPVAAAWTLRRAIDRVLESVAQAG